MQQVSSETRMLRACLTGCFALGLIAAPAALAASAKPRAGDDFSLPDDKEAKFEADTADVFGFSDGTDTSSQGERELGGQIQSRFGKRVLNPQNDPPGKGRYGVLAYQLSLQYGVTDDFSIETSVFQDARHVRRVPDMANSSKSQFNGASVQFKYRLLERTRESRYGLALQFEPRYSRIDDHDASRGDSFKGETKLLWDARLIDGLLWYGGNLTWEPEIRRSKATGVYARQSGLSVSQALSIRVLENAYVGVEAIYSRQYDGLAFRNFQTQALSVGPTFQYKFNKGFFIAAAYQMQVWGHEKGDNTHGLDLNNYERHYAKVKFGLTF